MTGRQQVTHTSYVRRVRAGMYFQNVHAESVFVGNNAINGRFSGAVLLGTSRTDGGGGDCCCAALLGPLVAELRTVLVELRRPAGQRP